MQLSNEKLHRIKCFIVQVLCFQMTTRAFNLCIIQAILLFARHVLSDFGLSKLVAIEPHQVLRSLI